jgi:LacI family transcriptional regulator
VYISLKDVAARAGVSFQTASKVLNGRTDVVSAATRDRILRVAQELGYVPNALARGLVRQTSLTVGIVADDFSDFALSQFVVAAQRTLETAGHTALIASTSPDADARLALRRLREHRVDGILLIAPSMEDDKHAGEQLRAPLPAVSLNHVPGGGVPTVGSDHARTGALAAGHLLSLGHRSLGTVIGPARRRVVVSRLAGFRSALRAAGVTLPAARVVATSDWTAESAHAAAHLLLDAEPDVTALFVHSDLMALGVLAALRERGVRVPADCSVVACDDLPIAAFAVPPLTTVRVPFQETGAHAAELLLALIRGEEVPPRRLLPVRLVHRDSTAPPPADPPHVPHRDAGRPARKEPE